MRYYKIINDGYLIAIGTGSGGIEITEEEYESILSIINDIPSAASGYDHRLKENLTWELYERPIVVNDEVGGDELITMLEEVL